MKHYAGLDVSVKETAVCIVDENGRICRETKVVSHPEDLSKVLSRTLLLDPSILKDRWFQPAGALFGGRKMISFKGAHFPKEVILFAVFFYVRYTVSYRDLEEIMAERGVAVDHATLNRWVAKYSPWIAINARRRKTPTERSWRMDETYIEVKGEWVYLYRAVDKLGKTLDFMLSKRRNKAAATKFFARALEVNGLPRKIVIDRSGANTADLADKSGLRGPGWSSWPFLNIIAQFLQPARLFHGPRETL